MNNYETIIIFDPGHYKGNVKIFRDMCQEFMGKEYRIKEDILGIKKLAYPIKNHQEGYYAIFTWRGTANQVIEFERNLRINDSVIKFMTLRTESDTEFEKYSGSCSLPENPDVVDLWDLVFNYKNK